MEKYLQNSDKKLQNTEFHTKLLIMPEGHLVIFRQSWSQNKKVSNMHFSSRSYLRIYSYFGGTHQEKRHHGTQENRESKRKGTETKHPKQWPRWEIVGLKSIKPRQIGADEKTKTDFKIANDYLINLNTLGGNLNNFERLGSNQQ